MNHNAPAATAIFKLKKKSSEVANVVLAWLDSTTANNMYASLLYVAEIAVLIMLGSHDWRRLGVGAEEG
jgi:hypothetical protein